MRVVFLSSTAEDLLWFRNYYTTVFPQGDSRAQGQIRNICQLLASNPHMGQLGEVSGTREMHIPKTPFTLIYRVTAQHIEVLRLWDQRQGKFD